MKQQLTSVAAQQKTKQHQLIMQMMKKEKQTNNPPVEEEWLPFGAAIKLVGGKEKYFSQMTELIKTSIDL